MQRIIETKTTKLSPLIGKPQKPLANNASGFFANVQPI
jgi:hypothetical protein